ncbi:MAG: S8 family serine peptidase [Bacteroidetes bacterium]|nr:S8 family serine peptidase [Bacteroidota bacterium]
MKLFTTMVRKRIALTAFLMVSILVTNAQNIISKQNNLPLNPNFGTTDFFQQKNNWSSSLYKDNYYVIVEFAKLPNKEQKLSLKKAGIQICNYYSRKSYLTIIPAAATEDVFKNYHVKNIVAINPSTKIATALADNKAPDWAKKITGMYDVVIQYFGSPRDKEVQDVVVKLGGEVLGMSPKMAIGTVRIPIGKIEALSQCPLIKTIAPVPPARQTDNNYSRNVQRDNVLESNLLGQRGLTGAGVRINITDEGDILHEDFLKRANHECTNPVSDHSTHCSGTIAGAGLLDPNATGVAPKATLYSWSYDGSPTDTLLVYTPIFNFTITSNSWGYVGGYYSVYDYTSYEVDSEAVLYDSVTQCQAAANSGPGFWTISAGANSAKNNITVGALDRDVIAGFSSRGPSNNGRLKPEVCANGVNVYSTVPGNGYDKYSGTSMATPNTAGTVALIQERFRQLHGGKTPENFLVKAVLMNTAQDLGNPGPDYSYGFGRIDGLKSVRALEQGRYLIDSVGNSDTFKLNFTLPKMVLHGKLMLNWNDLPPISLVNLLVNNLDVKLITPANDTILPWSLNSLSPSSNATRGIDTINTEEQITLDSMLPGAYTVLVVGTSVPFGPQNFALTWETDDANIELTAPFGGETYSPIRPFLNANSVLYTANNEMTISWNSTGTTNQTQIYFSADAGTTWALIDSVPAYKRDYFWQIPDTATSLGLIKITDGNFVSISDSTFTIMQSPIISNLVGCDKKVVVNWEPIKNAASYDVMRLLNDSAWVVIKNTTDTAYIDSSIAPNKNYWYSIRAVTAANGYSNRCIAREVNTKSTICITATDAGISSIDSPAQGFCTGVVNVYASIKNYGLNILTSATVTWSANGVAKKSVSWTGKLGLNATASIFLDSMTMTNGIVYKIIAKTTNPNGVADGNSANDSTVFVVKDGLSGAYTIGGATPDYATIGDAVNDLNSRGVCGAVVFNISDGSYTEQLTINSIRGASSINTVTFQSLSGDSSKVNWNYPNYSNNWVVNLFGASNVVINKITMQRTGTYFNGSRLISLTSTDNVKITNCRLIGQLARSTAIYDNNGYNSNLLISNNLIRLANYGIYLAGGYYEDNNTIINNTFDSTALTSVVCYTQTNLRVIGNAVNHLGVYGFFGTVTAFDLQACDSNLTVAYNKIDCHESYVNLYAINLNYCVGSPTTSSIIYNNFISAGADSFHYVVGISHNNASYQQLYFNSINAYGTNATYPYYSYSSFMNNNKVANNNFTSAGAGAYPVLGGYASFYDVFDYNNLYATNGIVGNFGGVTYYTLATYISGTGQTNTISSNPGYISNSDLHVSSNTVFKKGVSISGFTKDIDGETRATNPTIGADEIYLSDAGIMAITQPDTVICAANKDVWVKLRNFGTDTLKNVDINWAVNGVAQTVYVWKGTLAPAATDSLTIGSYAFVAGTYSIKSWTNNPNSKTDAVNTNDTFLLQKVRVNPLPSAIVGSGSTVCSGTSTTIGGAAVTGNTYSWTSSPTGFTSTASSLSVSPTTTTRYYLTENITATGCSKSDSVTINVNPLPAANVGTPTTICNGAATTIGAASVSGNTYSWTSNPSGFSSITSNPSVSPTITTKYYLTESITATGCTKSDSVTITVNPLPTVNVGTPKTICFGGSATLGLALVAKQNYKWSNGDSTAQTLVSPTSTQYYKLTQKDSTTGCVAIDSVMVTVNSLPTVNIGTPKAICFGGAATLGLAAVAKQNYKWSNGDSTAQTTVSPSSTQYYKLTQKDSSTGCAATDSVMVTVNPNPKAKFSASAACIGKATAFTDSSTNATKQIWFFGDGDTSTANNPTHTYKIVGSYKATLAVMSTAGCVDSASQTVVVNPNPVATFTTTLKGARTFDFKATDTTQASYNWSFGDGLNATAYSTSHTYTKDSTFTVSLTVTNSFGCTDKKDSNLKVTLTGLINVIEGNFSASIFPNPFKESTNIHYTITQRNHVKVYITDVLGRAVCTLMDANQNAGEYNLSYLPTNYAIASGGVYFVHFNIGDKTIVQRMVMVK